MVWELLVEGPPFRRSKSLSVLAAEIQDGKRLDIDMRWDQELQDLLKQCWEAVPFDRIDAEEALDQLTSLQKAYSSTTPD